jgi:diguanylate cyclase (GGDEF)-like protein
MNEYVERLLQQKSDRCSISLLVIDIDDFKIINDTYGHDFGDKVIQEVAKTIKAYIGSQDIVARWGGEEYLVLLTSHYDAQRLEETAETILEKISKQIISYQNVSISVTVTCGGVIRKHTESFSQLFIKADEALYQGKHEGKNRYIYADST